MPNRFSQKGMNRFLALATGSQATSKPVVFACAILSILLHLAPNGNTVNGSIFVRILIATLSYCPAFALVYLTSNLTSKPNIGKSRISIMLIAYFIGGAIRGLCLALSFYFLGMANSLHLLFRIPASAIPFGLAMLTATYAVAALGETRTRINSLNAIEFELVEALSAIDSKELSLQDRTINQVNKSLEDEIAPLFTINRKITIAELQNFSADIVRPISHRLLEKISVWKSVDQKQSTIRLSEIFMRIRPELSFQPVLLSLLCEATGLTAFFYFFGWQTAILLIICTSTLLYFSTLVMLEFTKRYIHPKSLLARIFVMTSLLLLLPIPTAFVSSIILRNTNDPLFVYKASFIVVPLFGWFIELGAAAQLEEKKVESEVKARIDQLRWLKARLNLLNWFEQGQLARIFHGPIQGAITKCAIQMKDTPEVAQELLVEKLQQEILQYLDPQYRWSQGIKKFSQQCQELAENWLETCNIEFSISPQAESLLSGDPAGSSVAWDIVHESCNNSIQHGSASWISVRVLDTESGLVEIDVIDNGENYSDSSKLGFGSKMVEACSIRWDRKRSRGLTQFNTSLPLQPN